MKNRVFVDMDGVLCEYRENATMDDLRQDGFFSSLRPVHGTVSAVRKLLSDGNVDVYILSSVLPERETEARREKNGWLDRYLPEIGEDRRIYPLCGTSKAECVGTLSENDVLLDDYSVNLSEWVSAGGSGIKILNGMNGRNGTFVSGPRVQASNWPGIVSAVYSAIRPA